MAEFVLSTAEEQPLNPGAFIFKKAILSEEELRAAQALADQMHAKRSSVHNDGRYADIQWYEAGLDSSLDFVAKVLREVGVTQAEVIGFYWLEPGARIHPHRDLTGASVNHRIRFHVPIKTNPGVKFVVKGERVIMEPGDLWCLDTSYRHSVANEGDEPRVHLIVECQVSEKAQKSLPKGLRAKVHTIGYLAALGGGFVHSLVVNSIKDPAHFRAQMGMVARFIRWRFLGQKDLHGG